MRTQLDILLVEDNEGDVEMTRRALNTVPVRCHLTVAHTGDQALEILSKTGKYEGAITPQLILLDINMPRMDGKQFLEKVKTSAAFKCIPVVMFTSSESPQDIKDCFERHANGYVVKPFDGKAYAIKVHEMIHFWSTVSVLPN